MDLPIKHEPAAAATYPCLRALWPADQPIPALIRMHKAADLLGMSRPNLYNRVDELGLERVHIGGVSGVSVGSMEACLTRLLNGARRGGA